MAITDIDLDQIPRLFFNASKIEIAKRLEGFYDLLHNTEAGRALAKMYSKNRQLAIPVAALISVALEEFHRGDKDFLESATDILADGVSEIYVRLDRAAEELDADESTVEEAKNFFVLLAAVGMPENRLRLYKALCKLEPEKRLAVIQVLSGFDRRALTMLAKGMGAQEEDAVIESFFELILELQEQEEVAKTTRKKEAQKAHVAHTRRLNAALREDNTRLETEIAESRMTRRQRRRAPQQAQQEAIRTGGR